MIIENLARNFSKEEMVLLGGSRLFQQDQERSEHFPKVYYHFTEFNLKGRGDRFFSWARRFRFNSLVKRIEEIIDQEKIGFVLAVYPDDYYCLAACRAATNRGVVFSSYFHNTYVENTAVRNPKKLEIQTEIFSASKYIFVMSNGMREYYLENYKTLDFLPLVHTFDKYPRSSPVIIPGIGKKVYKLVALGNFNESNMDATIRFANAIKEAPQFSLSLYTHVPPLLLKKRGLDPSLYTHMGYIDPDAVHNEIQKYDICVLTHGLSGGYGEIEYRTIFPTRTIPLLLAGKPIVAHAPRMCFLSDFIREHKCAALIDTPDQEIILNVLFSVVNDESLQRALSMAARKAADIFYGPNVADFLRGKISKHEIDKI